MGTKTPVFEHDFCGRCGGSGEYSYNAMHGSRCYGCNGTGYKLTKRGAAAQRYLNCLRLVRSDSIKVGDTIYDHTYGFCKVLSVKAAPARELGVWQVGHEDDVSVRIETTKVTAHQQPEYMVRKGFDAETKSAQVTEALAYQDTLTKTGKPRKRA